MPGQLAITSLDEFIYGRCPRPVTCGRGVEIGRGTVIPEINFTLPRIDITKETWAEIRAEYTQMIEGVCRRAVDLEVPALLVEFETLPEMTTNPEWGLEIVTLLSEVLKNYYEKYGLKNALRLTPNDTREFLRPPLMRQGKYWGGMVQIFNGAAAAGADLIGIESTGGKEINDEALLQADLHALVFALGVLGARDMKFLWTEIVGACRKTGIIPSGDTACGFANTAMVLADQKHIPKVLAAVIRVAAVPRSLVAYETGAVGPSKDCAYEGPYMKAIAGVPISMEGRTAAVAHLSPVGNITQAVCDCWSNESVQNRRLLSTFAPTVSLEQLAYDCRLMNSASNHHEAQTLQKLLVESDAGLDPQAWVLRPDVVLKLSAEIMSESTPYLRTRRAVLATLEELNRAFKADELNIPARETRWLDVFREQAEGLPESEETFYAAMSATPLAAKILPEEYGIGKSIKELEKSLTNPHLCV